MLRDRTRVLASAFKGLELLENRLCFTAVTFTNAAVEISIDQSTVTNNGDTSDFFQPYNITKGFSGDINTDITPTGFQIIDSDLNAGANDNTFFLNFGAFLNNDKINHKYRAMHINLSSGVIPITYSDATFAPELLTSTLSGDLVYDTWGGSTASPDTEVFDLGQIENLAPFNDPADNPDQGAKTASLAFNGLTATLTIPFTVTYTYNLPMYYNSGTNARAGSTSGPTTDFVHTLVLNGTITASTLIYTNTTGAIQGNVFSDVQSAADSSGNNGIEDVEVYLDDNNNNVLDSGEQSVLTNEDGDFFFPWLASNVYNIRHIVPDGYRSVYPAVPVNDVEVIAGQVSSDRLSDGNPANFGDNQLPGTVTGVVYRDTNANGQKDVGENGIFAARVYVDIDNDNIRDPNEPTALTDANGLYTISTIPGNPIPTNPNDPVPAAYVIRHVIPGGLHATEPQGGTYPNVHVGYGEVLTGFDFGDADAPGSISGFVFEDLNGNGTKQLGEPLIPNVRVYIDANNNSIFDVGESNVLTDQTGLYTFSGLVVGTYRIRHVVPSGYALSGPAGGSQLVTLGTSQDVLNRNFGDVFVGSGLSGTVFNDLNDNGVRDFGEPGLAGVRVFLDSTGDAKYNTGERFAITDGSGFYSFSGLKPGRRIFYHETPTGYRLTRPAVRGFYSAKIIADQAVSGVDFGDTNTGQITGLLFNDANSDGVKATTERGIGPWVVFMDTNNNGVLDTGETAVNSDKYGTYIFRAVQPGTYNIRQEQHANWRVVKPRKSVYSVTIAGNSIVAGRDFANTDNIYLTGIVFLDRNFDGAKAKKETIQTGFTVYDDQNNNGRFDAGSDVRATYSATEGYFYFNNLTSGVHTIRIVLTGGVNQSSPVKKYYSLKVKRAAAIGALNFGLK